MKKRKMFFMAMLLSVSMMLGACGGSEAGKKDNATAVGGTESVQGGAADCASETDGATASDSDTTGEALGDYAVSEAETEDMAISEDKACGEAECKTVVEGGVEDIGAVSVAGEPEPVQNQQAGQLTAGEWCDNENWGFYQNLFADGNSYSDYKNEWNMNFLHRVKVHVTADTKDKDVALPVPLAKVQLLDEKGDCMWQAVSDYEGNAYLFYQVTKEDEAKPFIVKVSKGDVSTSLKLASRTVKKENNSGQNVQDQSTQAGDVQNRDAQDKETQGRSGQEQDVFDDELEIRLPLGESECENAKILDLMFVVDTTGSMSDEITYLQAELKDVIRQIQAKNPEVTIRTSVNFYRDKGDAYVVKDNAFLEDIDKVMSVINDEYADGGGDYPEAVSEALANAVDEHTWDRESVKLLFLVLDAPPHDGKDENKSLQKTIKEMAAQGIRVIPVASSGVDKSTEFICRKFAVATGGTYTFLTDDSGIGGSHIEATVGDYEVTLLNDLLVQIANRFLG